MNNQIFDPLQLNLQLDSEGLHICWPTPLERIYLTDEIDLNELARQLGYTTGEFILDECPIIEFKEEVN